MLVQRWIIVTLMIGCKFDSSIPSCAPGLECQSDEDCSPGEGCHPLYCRCLPLVPYDAGVESEAEAEGDPCGDGECAADESCRSCRGDCCPDCGDGECGAGEDAEICAADCGCQVAEACTCGSAPFGCFCGPGCLETGTCCPDADVCGVSAELGQLTEGCGNGTCETDETCAICISDCGLCGEVCPPLPVIVHYRTDDDRLASELVILARFIVDGTVGEWLAVRSLGEDTEASSIASAVAVPEGATAVDVWVGYRQANGRLRASCEGEDTAVGVLSASSGGSTLSGVTVQGAPREPGNCAHRYALK